MEQTHEDQEQNDRNTNSAERILIEDWVGVRHASTRAEGLRRMSRHGRTYRSAYPGTSGIPSRKG